MSSIISMIALGLLAMSSSSVALGPAAVNLRTAGNFAIIAQTGVSTVPASAITGNIGVSPVASTALTGFSLVLDSTGTFSTSPQVTGKLFSASYKSPTPSTLTTAVSDMQTAFTDASGRTSPNFLNLGSGNLGGLVLTPGLYKFTTGVSISTGVTIAGLASDTWIFQIAGNLGIAAGIKVTLAGGAVASNIVWVVAGATAFQANSHFEGIVLAKTSVTLVTGASANGRLLAQTAVALQEATLVAPA